MRAIFRRQALQPARRRGEVTSHPLVETYDDTSLSNARKVYDNGIVYILLPDGKRYNLQGAEVK